jgi:hypothetical protein
MNVVQCMTHAELAKALKLSRPTISRDVAKGMPLDGRGAQEWREEHKEFRGDKTGPKTIEYDEPEPQQLPRFLLREIEEIRLARRVVTMDAKDGDKLDALRAEYDKVPRLVQADYLARIDHALTRRLLSVYGSPDDCFESFVRELMDLADRWRKVLAVECDESADPVGV